MPEPPSASFEQRLATQVAAALHGVDSARVVRCTLVRAQGVVADSQAIYHVDDELVLFVAPERFPLASVEQALCMQAMRQRLGKAGRVVLQVRGQGVIDGRTFVLIPRCEPLARGQLGGRIARWRAGGEVLAWVRELALLADAPDDAAREEFFASLTALQAITALPAPLRQQAAALCARLQEGTLQACHVPMHGDLWTANVMHRRDRSLVVIDWGGSRAKGYGIYDLIRAATSFGVSRRRLAREIAWHAQALGGAPDTAALHLLGALGHYARNLGEFPLPRFVDMANNCWHAFEGATPRQP